MKTVALVHEFNSSVTRDEYQEQFLFQIVKTHQKDLSAQYKTVDAFIVITSILIHTV